MVAYPALTRSTVVKRFEFDDVRYTMALLTAMAHSQGMSLQKLQDILAVKEEDVADLMDDSSCNHSLPFEVSVKDMLERFGASTEAAQIPSFEAADAESEIPSLLVELIAFNSENDESKALYDLMSNGALDWLMSEDFKSLPVPLNQVAAEQIEQNRAIA